MINENSLDGQILEVDLEYPDEVDLELHELLNDYPLAPDKLEIMICCQNIVVILQKIWHRN